MSFPSGMLPLLRPPNGGAEGGSMARGGASGRGRLGLIASASAPSLLELKGGGRSSLLLTGGCVSDWSGLKRHRRGIQSSYAQKKVASFRLWTRSATLLP